MGSKPKSVTPPDPTKTSEEQAGFNLAAATSQQRLNQTNQRDFAGNTLQFSETGTREDGTPIFNAATTLSAPEQAILGQNQQGRLGAATQANQFLASGNALDPTAQASDIQSRLEGFATRLEPQIERDRAALSTRLANQGINIGTEAHREALAGFGRNVNDARNSQALAFRGQAFNEAQQPFNRFLQLGQLGQPVTPNFQNTPQASIAAPNFQAAQANNLAIQQSNFDREAQSKNALFGGLGQIGATVGLGLATGGLGFGSGILGGIGQDLRNNMVGAKIMPQEITPASLLSRRRIGQSLAGSALRPRNIQHPVQALAQAISGTVGGLQIRGANRDEAEARREANAELTAALDGNPTNVVAALTSPFNRRNRRIRENVLLAQLKGKASGANREKFSMNPFLTADDEGNVTANQLSNRGGFRTLQLPKGQKPTTGFKQVDMGDSTAIIDKKTNQVIQVMPKNIAAAASQKAQGKAQGEAVASLASVKSKMPGLKVVVAELNALAEKATFTAAGQLRDLTKRQLGLEPGEGAIARAEYIAKVDNQILPMLRDTFGAAFTEREGRELKATLGDPDKSPKEKQAVLRAFIQQKIRNIEALETQAGSPTLQTPFNPQATPGQRADDGRGVTPSGLRFRRKQ